MKKLNTIAERVEYLIKINNLSVAAAAKKCKVPQSRLNDIVTGTTKNPHTKTISKIAQGLKAREAWLAVGDGEICNIPPVPTELSEQIAEAQAEYNGRPVVLTNDEYGLLKVYRSLSDHDKEMLVSIAHDYDDAED